MKWLVVLVLAIVAAACRRGGRESFGYWPIDQPADTVASKAMFDVFMKGDGDLVLESGFRNLPSDFVPMKAGAPVPAEAEDIRMRV